MREMGALGFLGSTLQGYGCAGVNHVCYGLVAREIERVDSSYRSSMSVQSSLVMYPIYAYGSEEQRQKYLPGLATGELVGCFGLTEPGYGSDAGGMITRARKVDGGWVLKGAKMWITHSPVADVFVVWAKDEQGRDPRLHPGEGHEGVVRPEDPGQVQLCAFRSRARSSWTTCSCPRTNLLPRRERAQRARSAASTRPATGSPGARWARPSSAGMPRGSTRWTGIAFGRPLAANQLIQLKLANMQTEIALGAAGRAASGPADGRGRAAPEMISLIKRNSCGKALDIARVARDMHGGNGIADEYHVIRHMMNLEAVNTYEGTHDVHALILGRARPESRRSPLERVPRAYCERQRRQTQRPPSTSRHAPVMNSASSEAK